jgi:hypothetical protein
MARGAHIAPTGTGSGGATTRGIVVLGIALAILALPVDRSDAVCCPFPPIGGSLQSSGQTNLVVLDEAAGRVTVVPNVGLQGEGRTFSLVVPTPSLPELEPASSAIWPEAQALTSPRRGVRGDDESPFGCGTESIVTPADAPEATTDGGVIVLGEETVGAFEATILTAGSATALVDWLRANDFAYTAADSQAFAPYVDRAWIFTAMKLDSTAAELPPVGVWSVALDPVAISFDAETLEVPLPILGINRGPRFDVTFLVVADRRMTLPGFRTRYANRITPSELRAMREEAPTFAEYLDADHVLVRLHRGFLPADDMNGSPVLAVAASDDEVIPGLVVTGGVPAGPLLLVGVGLAASVAARRRRRWAWTLHRPDD